MAKKQLFEPETYQEIAINKLILFCMHRLKNKGLKCTFGVLLEECFNLFPQTFELDNHPDWPDARKLDRPLRALRKEKLIKGEPQSYFSLTSSGEKAAQKVITALKQKKLL